MTVPPAPSGDVVEGERTSLADILQDIPLVRFPASAVTGFSDSRWQIPTALFIYLWDILTMNLCNPFFKPTDIVYLHNLMGQQDPKVLVQWDLMNNSLVFSMWKK